MSFKKMLGVILIIIVAVFGFMLTTSYAWYSYENASTKFDVVTANENIEIVFQSGDYINTDVAIPIKSVEIDRYSDKYDFNIRVKKKIVGNEMVAKISLVNIEIDDELKKIDEVLGDSPFKVELFYQGSQVGSSISGKDFTDSSFDIGDVVLSDDMDNQFELRVYLLDNGGDQSNLMNQKFQAKIDVNVISRANASFISFDEADLVISDVVIDGKSSKSLPTTGFYTMSATCEKGSNVSWDSLNKTLIYDKGSYVHDQCKLSFVKDNTKVYLKDVTVGSYVNYVGNNGCNGNYCYGENANYVSDFDMGYCVEDNYHFYRNGWRVAYTKDNTAYLVSAGSVDCFQKDDLKSIDLDQIAMKFCNMNYAYQGICNENSIWSLKISDIDQITLGKGTYQNDLIDNGGYYWFTNLSNELNVWNPRTRSFGSDIVSSFGVRPVIRLDSSVLVVGGSGTSQDPYLIQK